jgi:hypothetical protein
MQVVHQDGFEAPILSEELRENYKEIICNMDYEVLKMYESKPQVKIGTKIRRNIHKMIYQLKHCIKIYIAYFTYYKNRIKINLN